MESHQDLTENKLKMYLIALRVHCKHIEWNECLICAQNSGVTNGMRAGIRNQA